MSGSWERSRRLDYIAWRLTVHASVRRQHLVEAFGVSMAQASADIQQFLADHPSAVSYDKSAKQYVPADARHRILRGWTDEALAAWAKFSATHAMGWR